METGPPGTFRGLVVSDYRPEKEHLVIVIESDVTRDVSLENLKERDKRGLPPSLVNREVEISGRLEFKDSHMFIAAEKISVLNSAHTPAT